MKRSGGGLFKFSVAWIAICLLPALAPLEAAQGRQIFKLTDPFGDDHGDGSLIYPRRSDLNAGDLDLLEVKALSRGEFTVFQFVFARNIRKPGRESIDTVGTMQSDLARHGFYTFNIDLYIDADREYGSGELAMLPGRLAVVGPSHAWEKVVAITPRPHTLRGSLERAKLREWKAEERLERSLTREDIKKRKRQITEELIPLVYFPNRIDVVGRRLDAWIPNAFLGGEAQPDWGYVIAITGARLEQRFRLPWVAKWSRDNLDGMVLPIIPGADDEAFGGGLEDEPLQPPLVDIVVPEGESQEELLRSFDSRRSRPAQLPAVVPADILGVVSSSADASSDSE